MKNGFIRKTASCKLCGEYSRKRGCISKHCPYLAERVAAGALNYKGAVMEAFGSNPLFRDDLTTTKVLYERTHQCFTKHGLEFAMVNKAGLSIDEYTLLGTAKTLYFGTEDLTGQDIAEREVISPEALPFIVTAVLIVRFGEAVLNDFA